MTPPTGTALLILAVFVLPGFVTLLFRERMFAVQGEETTLERLLNALFYSALVYALALGVGAAFGLDKGDVVSLYKGRKTLGEDLAAGATVALALPLVIAAAGLWWRRSRQLRPAVLRAFRISPSHSVESGWNEAFSRGDSCLVRVSLRDGRVVGGYFGTKSLAGYSEHARDLFIEERWAISPGNDWFTEAVEFTSGLWIGRDDIVSIEFYDYERSDRSHDSDDLEDSDP